MLGPYPLLLASYHNTSILCFAMVKLPSAYPGAIGFVHPTAQPTLSAAEGDALFPHSHSMVSSDGLPAALNAAFFALT